MMILPILSRAILQLNLLVSTSLYPPPPPYVKGILLNSKHTCPRRRLDDNVRPKNFITIISNCPPSKTCPYFTYGWQDSQREYSTAAMFSFPKPWQANLNMSVLSAKSHAAAATWILPICAYGRTYILTGNQQSALLELTWAQIE